MVVILRVSEAGLPEESKTDAVEKLLSEEKAIEDRKHALIADLLKQKEAAKGDFDDKLAKLGHQFNNSARPRRATTREARRTLLRNPSRKPETVTCASANWAVSDA